MPPDHGETAPGFEALCCDGETFRPTALSDGISEDGGMLVFFGFVFSAIAENWWKRYRYAGWHEFAVPVLGVCRDGPYAVNAFIRQHDLPFALFADVDANAIDAYGLRQERAGMGPTTTARRAVFVLDGDREVRYRWLAEDWISPVPRAEIETAVADL